MIVAALLSGKDSNGLRYLDRKRVRGKVLPLVLLDQDIDCEYLKLKLFLGSFEI